MVPLYYRRGDIIIVENYPVFYLIENTFELNKTFITRKLKKGER